MDMTPAGLIFTPIFFAYCSGYRVAARMKTSADTALSHTGFRCVKDN